MKSKGFQKAFGKRLREIRAEKGLSQEELGFKSGIHWTYVGGIERGVRNPCLVNIARLAVALDVPVKSLLDFEIIPEIINELKSNDKLK